MTHEGMWRIYSNPDPHGETNTGLAGKNPEGASEPESMSSYEKTNLRREEFIGVRQV
jgi:hypothetical protein